MTYPCRETFPVPMSHPPKLLLALPFLLFAAACDQIAMLDGSKARDADAVAVGSACRHSGRALEDCYAMYPDSPKAQVFAGWKEMNDYMTSNKIEVVEPTLVKAEIKADFRDKEKGAKHTQVPEARKNGEVKIDARSAGLPSTSAAAADPLAGLPKLPASAGDRAAADKGTSKGAAASDPKH